MLDTLSVFIFCTLNKMPESSVPELASVTGLSEEVVQAYVNHLLDLGLVEECEDGTEYKVA